MNDSEYKFAVHVDKEAYASGFAGYRDALNMAVAYANSVENECPERVTITLTKMKVQK